MIFGRFDRPPSVAQPVEQGPLPARQARATRARKVIASADEKLARYRQALDNGADPATIGQWMQEVQAERSQAERDLVDATPPADTTDDDLAQLVAFFAENIDRFHRAMNDADPKFRQALYDALGIVGRYTPGTNRLEVSLAPAGAGAKGSVGGGT